MSSGSDEPLSQDTGGAPSVDPSYFIGEDGEIKVERLTRAGVGTIISVLLTGAASLILGFAELPITFLEAGASFYADLLETITRIIALIVSGSFTEAAEFVLTGGPLAFGIAVALVGGTAFAVQWVIS
jgi:hypothetical protein